jgi:hypothetical protein
MSKIISIVEGTFNFGSRYNNYDGFIIALDNGQAVKLGIDNNQNCCENWGYMMSQDNFEEFVGSEIVKIEAVDEALNVSIVPDIYEGGVMFVNIQTTKGLLQFTAYNEHNGYYSHDAVVIENDVKTIENYL